MRFIADTFHLAPRQPYVGFVLCEAPNKYWCACFPENAVPAGSRAEKWVKGYGYYFVDGEYRLPFPNEGSAKICLRDFADASRNWV